VAGVEVGGLREWSMWGMWCQGQAWYSVCRLNYAAAGCRAVLLLLLLLLLLCRSSGLQGTVCQVAVVCWTLKQATDIP
jgi:hypothetical protein